MDSANPWGRSRVSGSVLGGTKLEKGEEIMLRRMFEKRKTLKITLILIAGFILLCFIMIDTVVVSGRCVQQIGDYSEFYFYESEYTPLFALNFAPGAGSSRHQLWFLPFQRSRMRAQIREDVTTILENALEDNSDIIEKYEISDDFKDIYVYFNNTWRDRLERDIPLGSILLKVELYHQLIHGFVKTGLGSILIYVDAEG
jgi:hypothetical protein